MSTGFLIRPNVILTAAHNVYSPILSVVKKIVLTPGRYRNSSAHSPIVINGKALCQSAIRVHPSYTFTDGQRIRYDFAIIIIPDSIIKSSPDWPKETSFEILPDVILEKGNQVTVAGYPASNGYDGSLMTTQSQIIELVNDLSFDHQLETETGNSGSPIWIEKDGKILVVGVHTFDGAGTKLTREYIEMILKWIKP
ncbi:trypsin-like serine peptidase [Pedobacter miscanthi]|uniref:trypsin-like serine peptidase n=1 Tax=Pedobacter miscanthi TaxID=2259170 RepID=UPI002931DE3A|nr:trypsin-like peptidase domain-containing protein [Pedobacter miscanthi]